jgi:rhodanese-related sulfurtransferase
MTAKPTGSTLVVLFTLLAGCLAFAGETEDAIATIEVVAAKDFVADHDNAVIIDVRTPIEFEMSHIPGAVNVNVQDDAFGEMIAKLDTDKTYIVHCTKNPVGGRSMRALDSLQELGFKNLYSLEGGYLAWQDAELPLTEPAK